MAEPEPAPYVKRKAPTVQQATAKELEKLFADVTKPVHIPEPPKARSIRAAHDLIKNVQGSSSGAGSGEFHIYKASRRREYERLQIMDEEEQRELAQREFEAKKAAADAEADARTSKNRAKRLKKRAAARAGKKDGKGAAKPDEAEDDASDDAAPGEKKRRLNQGAEVVFRQPAVPDRARPDASASTYVPPAAVSAPPADESKGIRIVDDDGF